MILKLESTVQNGFGGPGSSAIGMIYSSLLASRKLDFFSVIFINQIGFDLQECIIFDNNEVNINIRYEIEQKFEEIGTDGRNILRLNLIHLALQRLAEKDSRVSKSKLDEIYSDIKSKNFLYAFVFRENICPKNRTIKASLVVSPLELAFEIYAVVTGGDNEIFRRLIFVGKPSDFYLDKLFANVVWKSETEFSIFDAEKDLEIKIDLAVKDVTFLNHSSYSKPPLFEMMQANISQIDQTKAYEDWLHSLPPEISGLITRSNN